MLLERGQTFSCYFYYNMAKTFTAELATVSYLLTFHQIHKSEITPPEKWSHIHFKNYNLMLTYKNTEMITYPTCILMPGYIPNYLIGSYCSKTFYPTFVCVTTLSFHLWALNFQKC